MAAYRNGKQYQKMKKAASIIESNGIEIENNGMKIMARNIEIMAKITSAAAWQQCEIIKRNGSVMSSKWRGINISNISVMKIA
jgi:hypothetical protein